MIAVRSLPLLLCILLLAPGFTSGALAHGEEDHGDGAAHTEPQDEPTYERTSSARSTLGPIPFYEYYEGAAFYGTLDLHLQGAQFLRDLDASHPWIVWEDAKRRDIHAYNVLAHEGVYLTSGDGINEQPTVSGHRVVWTHREGRNADLHTYDFRTGKTSPLITGDGNQQNPDLHDNWLVWEDDRDGTLDIWAHDFLNKTTFRVSTSDGRHSDPLIVGETVLWRTYRYNVWDIAWYHLPTGENGLATGDARIENPPFSNGHAAYILQEANGVWNVLQWDPVTRETTPLKFSMSNPKVPTAENDLFVQTHWDGDATSLAAYNLTTRISKSVTTEIELMDSPVLHGGILYLPTWNGTRAALLAFHINPVALAPTPTLEVDGVGNYGIILDDQVRIRGRVLQPGAESPVAAMAYSVDEGRTWVDLPPEADWSFILDTTELKPGRYTLRIAVAFEDRFPIETERTFTVPGFRKGADVGELGVRYHEYVINAFYARYFGTNPASFALLTLVAVAGILLLARWRLRTRPRKRPVIEYVRPEEPDEPPAGARGYKPPHRGDS